MGKVGSDGALSDLKLFVERGGESLAVDEKGNVYLAAGQVFVYSPDGNLIDTIEVPERPSQLLFGGADGHNFLFSHAVRCTPYEPATRDNEVRAIRE